MPEQRARDSTVSGNNGDAVGASSIYKRMREFIHNKKKGKRRKERIKCLNYEKYCIRNECRMHGASSDIEL